MTLVRITTAVLGALLRAIDRILAAQETHLSVRSPARREYSCPDDPICQHCPGARAGDVCLPDERRCYELVLRYGASSLDGVSRPPIL